jgi:hypothetical protein
MGFTHDPKPLECHGQVIGSAHGLQSVIHSWFDGGGQTRSSGNKNPASEIECALFLPSYIHLLPFLRKYDWKVKHIFHHVKKTEVVNDLIFGFPLLYPSLHPEDPRLTPPI